MVAEDDFDQELQGEKQNLVNIAARHYVSGMGIQRKRDDLNTSITAERRN